MYTEWLLGKTGIYDSIVELITLKKSQIRSSEKSRELTDDNIRFIRNNYNSKDKKFNIKAFMEKFNVNRNVISKVINNINYKNVK